MDEFIKIRIEELKVLRENVIQKQREELARIDVRIDELKSMLTSVGMDYASENRVDLDTVDMVSKVLEEEKSDKKEQESESDDSSDEENSSSSDEEDEIDLDIEDTSDTKIQVNSEEEDLEAMLNNL